MAPGNFEIWEANYLAESDIGPAYLVFVFLSFQLGSTSRILQIWPKIIVFQNPPNQNSQKLIAWALPI